MIIFYFVIYFLVLCFFIIERVLRKGNDAKTLENSNYDKKSTAFLGFTFVTTTLLLIITPLLNHFQFGTIKTSWWFNILGILIMLIGITIRITAAITLGRFYTRTLRKTDNHKIITTGVYQYIRHPGYLGTILFYVGASIAIGNIIILLIITSLVWIGYCYRISVEEAMLIEFFDDQYQVYLKRTKKLLPFIY